MAIEITAPQGDTVVFGLSSTTVVLVSMEFNLIASTYTTNYAAPSGQSKNVVNAIPAALLTTLTAQAQSAIEAAEGWAPGSSTESTVVAAATATVFAPVHGVSFTGVVATIQDPLPGDLANLTATIAWGDGTTSPGTIDTSGNISGTHTYVAAGPVTVTVTVTGSASGTTIKVAEPITVT